MRGRQKGVRDEMVRKGSDGNKRNKMSGEKKSWRGKEANKTGEERYKDGKRPKLMRRR